MAKIIGYDAPEEYSSEDEQYAHGMMGFYAVDIKQVIEKKEKELGADCEFVPMINLSNQGIEVPPDVQAKAGEVRDDWFIGVIRTTKSQNIVYWITGRVFGKYPDGEEEIMPSGCYTPEASSLNEDLLHAALSKAFIV